MKNFIYLILFFFIHQLTIAQCQLDTAVDFSVKDIHGNKIELFPILDEGKLVVIDFFSTSCGPCALFAPDIQQSYEDFGENSGNVFFMNIAWGDDNQGVAYFDSIYGVTSPSVSGSQGGGNQVHNNFLIQSTPTVILIGSDRKILEHYIWEPTTENLNYAIIAAGGSMVGIHDEATVDNKDPHVYPNPATGRINIRIDVEETALYNMEIFNLLGTRVHETHSQQFSSGSHILNTDLSGLPGGTYFIRLIRNGRHDGLSRLILLD